MKKTFINKLPIKSGVYFFKNKEKEILYIGKATNLKARVSSYFSADILEKRGPAIAKMILEIEDVDFKETDSVLEALVLEANLIKKYQPKYNTKEKSDKSFVYLIITKEEYPRLLIKREKEILEKKIKEKIKYSFGPFQSRSILEKALRIIRKIFPFFSKKGSYGEKSVLYRQMGYAPNIAISKDEYNKNILNIKNFFEGKKKQIIKKLEKQMFQLAKEEKFEKANDIKKQIFALKYIKDVSLLEEDILWKSNNLKRIEAYDVAHLQGQNMVGVMIVLENGQISKEKYKKFNIKGQDKSDDTKALKELLERRFKHKEWLFPDMIVTDGGVAQKRVVEKFLKDNEIKNVKVVSCIKDKNHKVDAILGKKEIIKEYKKQILLANAEAHRFSLFSHKQKRDKIK